MEEAIIGLQMLSQVKRFSNVEMLEKTTKTIIHLADLVKELNDKLNIMENAKAVINVIEDVVDDILSNDDEEKEEDSVMSELDNKLIILNNYSSIIEPIVEDDSISEMSENIEKEYLDLKPNLVTIGKYECEDVKCKSCIKQSVKIYHEKKKQKKKELKQEAKLKNVSHKELVKKEAESLGKRIENLKLESNGVDPQKRDEIIRKLKELNNEIDIEKLLMLKIYI
jgi:hypothetical protein